MKLRMCVMERVNGILRLVEKKVSELEDRQKLQTSSWSSESKE